MSAPSADTAPTLAVERLCIRTGSQQTDRLLVNDVDLSVGLGETLGVVGESGSGKSLTARAIMNLLPRGLFASGEILFDGLSVLEASGHTLRQLGGSRMSLLMQDPFTMLNPLQTVAATIRESLTDDRSCGRAEVDQEIDRRLEEVALGAEVKHRYPFELSGGMRQRVALAAALAGDPELLIADEPTTALDVTTQDEILRLLRKLQGIRGMALVLITHDLRLAFAACDRIEVMYAGSVVESAPAAELASRPMHPYTAALLLSDLPVGEYVAEIKSLPGRVPAADTVVDQCAFADRCAWMTESCVCERPPFRAVAAERASACVRIDEIRSELEAEVSSSEALLEHQVAERRAVGSILSVRSLSKSYETARLFGPKHVVAALRDVSFDIVKGESVGLVGETGSGKSSIGRCILGLVRPDSGQIELGDLDASDFSKLTRQERRRVPTLVQAVFQDPQASLNPARTIGSTLAEVLRESAKDGVEPQTVGELLGSVGLPSNYAERRPSAISGGERQRVAIARALAMRPQLLICDEAVASLDVSAQAQILELLRELRAKRGMSMLFITHDLSVVRQMADRIVVLYCGQIVEYGSTQAVLDDPSHPYTRRLLSAIPGQTEASGGLAVSPLASSAPERRR